jgi:Papain fold toxin 1, glutamine deamidase
VVLLEGLRETFNPDGVRAERAVDESAVLDSGAAERLMEDGNWSRTAEERIAPGADWGHIGDWSDAESAARRAGPGATVYVLMRRPSGEGHAFALRHTETGRLFWVDPQMPAGERLLAADNRPVSPAEWAQRGGDKLESAVSTRVLVVDSRGAARPELLVRQPESSSTARAITDAPSDHGYGKGGFEKEKPRYRVDLPRDIHPNSKIVTGLVNVTTDKSSEGKAILETVSEPGAMLAGEAGPFSSELIDRQREIDQLLHNSTRIHNTRVKIKDIFSDESKYTIKPGAEDVEVFADHEQTEKDAVQYTGGTDADYDWAFLYQLRGKAFNANANTYLLEGLDFGRQMARKFTASRHNNQGQHPYPGFLVEALHSDKNVSWVRAIATSAYLHNSAVLRWRMHLKAGSQSVAGPKNFTPAVSRVAATALIKGAPAAVQRFFADDPDATRESFLQTFLANDGAARERTGQPPLSDSDRAGIRGWRLFDKPGRIPGEPWQKYFDNFLLPEPDVPIDQYRAMGVRTRFDELDTNPSDNEAGLDLWELRYLDEPVVDQAAFEQRFDWLRTTLADVHREAAHSRRITAAETWQPVHTVSKFAGPNTTRDQFLAALDDAWNEDQAWDSQRRDALLNTGQGQRVRSLIDGLDRSQPATWHTLITELTEFHQRMSRFQLDQVGRHPIASSRDLLDRQLKQAVVDVKGIVGELKSLAPPWLQTSSADDRGRLDIFADQVVRVARQQQGPVQVHVDAGIPKGSSILARTAGQKEAKRVGDALLSVIRDRLRDAGLAVDRVSLVTTSRGSGSLPALGYTVADNNDRRAAIGWVTVFGAAPAPPRRQLVLPPIAASQDLGDLGMSSFLDDLNLNR